MRTAVVETKSKLTFQMKRAKYFITYTELHQLDYEIKMSELGITNVFYSSNFPISCKSVFLTQYVLKYTAEW